MDKEILYDHYKDTFVFLRDYIKQRDKYFLILVIIATLLLLFIYIPNDLYQIINTYIQSQIDMSVIIEFKIINSVLIFSYLAFIIKYVQINLLIENQYIYIHTLEDNLNCVLNCNVIQRESKAYLKNYPIVKDLIHYCYTLLIPFLLILISIYKIKQEIPIALSNKYFLIIDLSMCSLSIIIIILYILHLYSKIKLTIEKSSTYLLLFTLLINFIHNYIAEYELKPFVGLLIFIIIIILLIIVLKRKNSDNHT